MEKTKKWLNRVGYTLIYIAVINFVTFWVIAVYIGGDAINGKAENGHYYLASHGHYTEVSKELWTYSAIHTTSLFITHPIALLVGGLMAFSTRRRKNAPSSA